MPQSVGELPIEEEKHDQLIRAGDADLRLKRDATWDQVAAQTGRQATEQQRVGKKLVKELDDRIAYRRDGQGLTKKSAKAVDVSIRRAAEESTAAFEKRMERNLLENTRGAARSMATHLAERGHPPPSAAALDQIAKRVAEDKSSFAGATTAARVKAMQERQEKRLREALVSESGGRRRPDYERKQAAIAKMGATQAEGVGGKSTPGGSVLKDQQRMLVAESMRKAHNTDLMVAQHLGVRFGYRRLSSKHPRYKRKEICEDLNVKVVPGIQQLLLQAGFDPTRISLEGLYRIDDFPRYPHPFCKCWVDPLVPDPTMLQGDVVELDPLATEATESKDDAEGVTKETAAESLSLMQMDIPKSQLAKAAPLTQAMNAIASSAGLEGLQFSTRDVHILGVEGAARVMAEQANTQGVRKQLLGAMRKLMVEVVPQQKQLLDDLRTKRDGLLAQVDRDRTRILSETTSTRLRERIHSEFTKEVGKAYGNIRTLVAVEEALATKPGTPLQTTRANSEAEIRRRMFAQGLSAKDVTVYKRGSSFWAEVKDPAALASRRYVKEQREHRGAAKIKQALASGDRSALGVTPLRTRRILPGGFKFKLDRVASAPPAQQAGLKFVEERKSVLLNFAPGLGKTPAVIASVSDLAGKRKVKTAMISPPASVRQQMVVETLKFNEKDKVSYYVPSSLVAKSKSSIREALHADYETSFDVGRKVAKEGRSALTDAERKQYDKIRRDATAYADDGMKRLSIVPLSSRKAASNFDDHMRGSGQKDLFHIMGHDDLARVAGEVSKHMDYVAVDEIHQLTSKGTKPGSKKAAALPRLTGGRIKYKVGLSGTPVRNNLGEFHDIARWIDPDSVPAKDEFMRQYSNVTHQSDSFRQSTLNRLQRQIDSRVMTVGSPVEAKLSSAFNERISAEERGKQVRRLSMTAQQEKRAATIEIEFAKLKVKQKSLSASGKMAEVKERRAAMLKEMQAEVANGLGMSVAAYKRLQEKGFSTSTIFAEHGKRGKSPTPKQQRAIRRLEREVKELTKAVAPEAWRDTAHHSNVHGGEWKENAKALEVVKMLTTTEGEGGLVRTDPSTGKQGVRPTLIHLERFESIDMLKKALKEQGLRVDDYHGGLGPKERQARVAAMNDGNLDVLILTRAGSTGLNVQKASTSTIHFDLPYTFAEVEQRDARNWRNGQQNAVESRTLVQEDMYTDRRRLQLVEEKRTVVRAIDEASKIDDRVNPLAVLGTMKKNEMQSYGALVDGLGKTEANNFLRGLCTDLAGTGITTVASCPVRPERLARSSLRNDPVMGEVTRTERAQRDKEKGSR